MLSFLPLNTLKTLYYSLFHCHLVYALEIWSCVPHSLLQPLITKQKAAICIISNSHYNAHTEPLFKALSILPLTDLITLSNLKLFHKFTMGLTPSAFTNTWITAIEQRQNDRQIHLLYDLRNNDDFFTPLLSYLLITLPSLNST